MAIINRNQELMVGGDPEFLILDADTLDRASPYQGFNGTHGNLGSDGGMAEIRPAPGSPRQVTENIGHILRDSMLPGKHYHDKIMVSGGGGAYGCSAGGHIHFNVHFGQDVNGSYIDQNGTDRARILTTLDNFLGKSLQAMQGGQRIAGTSYGAMSAERTKSYGFEYRTPPGWLPDPAFTESVLSVAYLLMDKMVKDSSFAIHEQASELEYKSLIPTSGPTQRHWEFQVNSFLDFVFGGFHLDTLDMRERWKNPALLDWKRGNPMISMLGAFQERINQIRIEKEQRRIEQARIEEERRIQREAELAAQRIREAEERRVLEALQRVQATTQLAERNAFAALGPQLPLGSSKVRVRNFQASVFVHRRHRTENAWNPIDIVSQQTETLKVGALRVIEHQGGYSWHNYRVCSGRVSRRRPWLTDRSIQTRDYVVYMSKDLQPLIKRNRALPFKIRFVNIKSGGESVPRTVIFNTGNGYGTDEILELFRNGTKPRVAAGFYSLEVPEVRAREAQLAIA